MAENEIKRSPHGLFEKALLAEKKLKEEKMQPIVEENGIFSIKKDLEISSIILDPEFKELVDSVLG